MNDSSKKRTAVFLDRDGVINEKAAEHDYIKKWAEFKFLPNAIKAIKELNGKFLVIIVSNQRGIARSLMTLGDFDDINAKMKEELSKNGARVDGVYFCPHDSKDNCECRKPKIGMVKKAEKDFNIDLKDSYFIGDSSSDILCGKNAGLIAIGVKTGEGCKDCRVKPDYMFEDILEAVNFIMKKQS